MQFNAFVFPSPDPTYTHSDLYGRLIYVPKDVKQWGVHAPFVSFHQSHNVKRKEEELKRIGSYKGTCIPCLFLPNKQPSNKIVLHFHGNAEDIGLTKELLNLVKTELKVNVMVMEYKGYGLYNGATSAEGILIDAETVLLYLTSVLGFAPEDIIVFGRSIGSGPACYLASKFNLHSLILMSAFTSLRNVVKGFVGSVLQFIVAERFNNEEWLSKVKCPVFIIHGQKDGIVSIDQAKLLYSAVKTKCKLHTPEEMDHNSFDFYEDFIYPLMIFYEELGLKTNLRWRKQKKSCVTETLYGTEGSAGSSRDSGTEEDKKDKPQAKIFYVPIKAFNKPA